MKQKELVTTDEAAKYLGNLKANTLEGWRVRGYGPRYVKVGRLVRYSLSDLDAYIEEQTRRSTSQVAT